MSEHESKIEDVVYDPKNEEDALKYYLAAYKEADKYNQGLRARVIENREFYDGIDKELQKRASNPNVVRSSLYIHELRPAIDTREAAVLDRIDEDNTPVRLRPLEEYDIEDYPYESEEEILEMIPKIEDDLNRQLRESGYLSSVFRKHFHGAELQPISVVKAGIEEKKGQIAKVKRLKPNPAKLMLHLLKYQSMPPPEYKTYYEYGTISVKAYVEWCDWDEILYDPKVIDVKQLRYVIHRQWLNWNELVATCNDLGVPERKLRKIKESGGENEESQKKIGEEIQEDESDDLDRGYKDGKYLFAEMWFKHYDGEQLNYRVMYVVKNALIVKDKVTPYPGLEFPFDFMVAHEKLGTLEGDSSIDVAKTMQRVYSDLINALLDLYTYGIIPVLIGKKSATTMGHQPVWQPGEVIPTDDPGGLVALQVDVSAAQYLVPVIELLGSKIKQVLAAPDVDQGMNQPGAEDEKATKTRLRVQGAARRSRTFMKNAGDHIARVAEMVMAINQQDDPLWILPVEVEVPCLSGVYTPDEELITAQGIYEMAAKSPLYQMPEGLQKLKKLFEDILVKSRIKDIDSRLITDEELEAYVEFQQQVESMIDKPNNKEIANDGSQV